MTQERTCLFRFAAIFVATMALGQGAILNVAKDAPDQHDLPAPCVVDLKASDGVLLKATYFPAPKPGPGVLLFHQSNRTRSSWDDMARQLAAAGINTLTLDARGHGESGGAARKFRQQQDADLETAFQFLISQPGVQRGAIGTAGAGWLGVEDSVATAGLHGSDIKSLVLMSGETLRPGIEFLHEAPQLPELFVVADADEYPPTVEAMLLLYARSSSPSRKLIHYSGTQEAPWLWYETSDPGKVAPAGSHGTDLFKSHPELPGVIVQWFVNTLIKTPGHAPADPLAAAPILNQLEMPGGVLEITQQLTEARKRDPQAQLWPEVSLSIVGNDHMRLAEAEKTDGRASKSQAERKLGIEILKLNLVAYPDSADAHSDLADAYLADGQNELARQFAEKALAMLDSHKAPLSSWSDTQPRRDEVRRDAQRTLEQAAHGIGR